MYDSLRCQDYLFAVLTRGNRSHSARVIGSMFDFIYAPDNHQICIERLAHPSTRIVSLTITEKGYCEVCPVVVCYSPKIIPVWKDRTIRPEK